MQCIHVCVLAKHLLDLYNFECPMTIIVHLLTLPCPNSTSYILVMWGELYVMVFVFCKSLMGVLCRAQHVTPSVQHAPGQSRVLHCLRYKCKF